VAGLWLSHHHEEHLDRCVRWGPWHICRRCMLLWPATYGLIALQVLARSPARHPLDLLLPLLLLPPVIEFLEVHTGLRPYSPVRTWLLTPLLALALGRLLYRCMVIPWDPATWAVILVAGLPSAWAAWTFAGRAGRR
jgi:hypothetical protein